MGRMVDLDDIIDTAGVAEMLGLAQSNTVSLYRRRHADFPAPARILGAGHCLLWLRPEIEAWATAHPRRPRS